MEGLKDVFDDIIKWFFLFLVLVKSLCLKMILLDGFCGCDGIS